MTMSSGEGMEKSKIEIFLFFSFPRWWWDLWDDLSDGAVLCLPVLEVTALLVVFEWLGLVKEEEEEEEASPSSLFVFDSLTIS